VIADGGAVGVWLTQARPGAHGHSDERDGWNRGDQNNPRRRSDAKVIIVTAFDDDALRQAAMREGACGYALKDNLLDLVRLIETLGQVKWDNHSTCSLSVDSVAALRPQQVEIRS
jgi:DNA-binding NarL/FixJ family response regulator